MIPKLGSVKIFTQTIKLSQFILNDTHLTIYSLQKPSRSWCWDTVAPLPPPPQVLTTASTRCRGKCRHIRATTCEQRHLPVTKLMIWPQRLSTSQIIMHFCLMLLQQTMFNCNLDQWNFHLFKNQHYFIMIYRAQCYLWARGYFYLF